MTLSKSYNICAFPLQNTTVMKKFLPGQGQHENLKFSIKDFRTLDWSILLFPFLLKSLDCLSKFFKSHALLDRTKHK